VQVEGFTEADYGYFATDDPLRIGSPPALVALGQGAEPICNLIEPLGSAGQFGHGCAPPGADTGRAAIVSRRLGSGEVIYVAASGFGEYFRHFNPLLGSLLRAQWDRLLPDPIARVETDAPVELVLLRKGDDLIIHLVNHSAREHLAGHWYPVFTHMPEIRNIRCIIRWPGGPAKVVHVPSGQFARVEINGDLAMVTIPSLGFLSSLSVLDYFSGS
jgi:hypothetical protein